jgi:hypothetical protein
MQTGIRLKVGCFVLTWAIIGTWISFGLAFWPSPLFPLIGGIFFGSSALLFYVLPKEIKDGSKKQESSDHQ